MFWLAWCIFFPIRFVTKPGYYAAAKTPSLLLTVLGLDNFAQAAGWVTMDFACVGEWFLGSILFCICCSHCCAGGCANSRC